MPWAIRLRPFGAVVFENKPKQEWQAQTGLTADEFRAENERLMQKGYFPLILSGYFHDDASRFLVVWVKDKPLESLPQTGKAAPGLEKFDQAMQQFMRERAIHAGTLVVVKDGRL